MSKTGTKTFRMRLLIRPLMPRPRLASRLYLGPRRWILDALEVNDLLRKMTRTPGTTKRISLSKILPLMHYQVGPNPLWHSPKRTKTVVLAEENPDDKAKARIPLLLALMPLLSGKTRIKIRTRKTSLTLNATFVSRKTITPISAARRSQKTSVNLDNLHIGD